MKIKRQEMISSEKMCTHEGKEKHHNASRTIWRCWGRQPCHARGHVGSIHAHALNLTEEGLPLHVVKVCWIQDIFFPFYLFSLYWCVRSSSTSMVTRSKDRECTTNTLRRTVKFFSFTNWNTQLKGCFCSVLTCTSPRCTWTQILKFATCGPTCTAQSH